MEFKSLKNIETSFKQIRLFRYRVCRHVYPDNGLCRLNSYTFAEAQRQKIYVLDGGKSLMLALSQRPRKTVRSKQREHVKRFHELFLHCPLIRTLSKAISNGRCSLPTRAHSTIIVTFRKGVLQPYNLR